ncbi:MAG TPA: hypothetical protein VD993_11410 [Chitinophagaceae bacterium]|nr:hypothetical protein [Chitinophagaceae bacterium]
MKKGLLFFSVLLIFTLGYGQAYESSVQFQNKVQPAAVIELPYPPSVVNAAMTDYLSKKGRSKSNDVRGFTIFRNTEPVSSDSSNADLYLKTERKSRKENGVTLVSLLVMPKADTGVSNLHYLNMDEARAYLDGLATAIDAYNLELKIKEQNDVVIKAEAKYKSLVADGDELEKKRTELDKKIADNKNNLQHQLVEIENQKQKLTQWVTQRKS